MGLERIRLQKDTYEEYLKNELTENPPSAIYEGILSAIQSIAHKTVRRRKGKKA